MYKIAIVDDEEESIERLKNHLDHYFAENGGEYTVSIFSDGAELIRGYLPIYDIIFLDIQMDQVNGVRTAKKIRETDEQTIIVFVTRMIKYAALGYDIGVNNFIVKPVEYHVLEMKMKKVLSQLALLADKHIYVEQKGGAVTLREDDIFYIETLNHYIYYHTKNGEYKVLGTLKQVKEQLSSYKFKECNRSYLINLRYITAVNQKDVTVAGERLQISRNRRREFLESIAGFWGKFE